MQTKNKDYVSFLKRAKQLIFMDKLDEALQEVKTIGIHVELSKVERIQVQILRSLIYDQTGNYDKSLELVDQAYQECQRLDNPILEIDAIISLASAKFRIDEFSESLDLINSGEKLLRTLETEEKKEIIDRKAALKYVKGKIHRKKGNLDLALKFLHDSLSIKQNTKNLYEIADYHNILGIIHSSKGELDQALNYLQYSLKMFEELGIKSSIVKSLNNIGMIYWQKGELDQALDNFKVSLTISKDLENNQYIAHISLNIGLIYWNMGDLSDALDFYQKSLALSEKIENKGLCALCLNNMGILYQFKGELDQALEFYQKSLVLHEEQGKKQELALCFNNIGEIYHIKGFFDTASDYYKKSLILNEEISNDIFTSLTLSNLVSIAIDQGSTEHAQSYLQKLQEIDSKEENKHISQKFRLTKAMVLKESDRVVNIAEAQKLFEEVAHEEIISLEHNVTANLNLCELLLQELRATGNEEILMELKEVLSRLQNVAEGQNSYIWLAKTYWLHSKIALLEFDIKRSQELLTQAEIIANEKGFKKLLNKILSERDILLIQFKKWENVLEQKPSVSEIIELTQIEEMVERMIQKKLDSSDEEVMQYAVESRRLVEMWEKQ